MKKFLSRKNGLALLSILIIGAFFAVPHIVRAEDSPGMWDALTVMANFFTGAQSAVYGLMGKLLFYTLLWPLQQILGMMGGILDIVVRFSLNSKDLYESDGVKVGWTAFRDICNMVFIFVLIVASIKTIFQSKIPKDTIKNVILAAITINFSLYITKFILDIANIFAVWLYNSILGLVGGANGLGSTLIGVMNISAFFGQKGANPALINDASAFIAVLVISVITILVIIMIVKSTFLFLSRTVAFVFHMIMSPLGLMSKFGLIPETFAKEYDWWDSVKKDALMPVVFFLLLYISLYFTSSIQGTFVKRAEEVKTSGTEWLKADVMAGNSFEFSDFIIFLLIYMLFDQCYKISRKYTSTIANQIEGYAKGAAGLAAGVVGVGAIGSLGKIAVSSSKLQGAASGSGFSGIASRMALRAADKAQSSGFGISGAMKNLKAGDIPIIGKGASAFAKDSEKGLKGINEGSKKRFEKDQEEFAKLLGKGAQGDALRLQYAENLKKGGMGMGLIGLSSLRGDAADKIKEATDKDFDKNAQKEVDKAVKKNMEEKGLLAKRDEVETAKTTHDVNAATIKTQNKQDIEKREKTIEDLKKNQDADRKKLEEAVNKLREELKNKPEETKAVVLDPGAELAKAGFNDKDNSVNGFTMPSASYAAVKTKKISEIEAANKAATEAAAKKNADALGPWEAKQSEFKAKQSELDASKQEREKTISKMQEEIVAMEQGIAAGELEQYKALTEKIEKLRAANDTESLKKELDTEFGKKWQRAQGKRTGKVSYKDGKEEWETQFGLIEEEANKIQETYAEERRLQEAEVQKLNDKAGFRKSVLENGKESYTYTKDAYTSYKDLFSKVKTKADKKAEENRRKAEEKLSSEEKKEDAKSEEKSDGGGKK